MATRDIILPQGDAGDSPGGLGSVTEKISKMIFSAAPWWWWVGFTFSFILFLLFVFTLASVAIRGTGLWGIKTPEVWGMAIVNLIFWIGIGHAGTFISAFLLLMRQRWRGAFSRFAEGMTLFALAVAGMFPLFHLGRVEFFYWIVPYPNSMILNPQFRSALSWDFFAISTYGLVSLLFWYIDLIPDLGAMRDKAKRPWVKMVYGTFAMGWRGDSAHWAGLHRVAFFLAALAAPLVISVHSIVGMDFAIGNLPGWHHTIFPPFFVVGAIYSGFAMVVIFAALLRSGFGLQDIIKDQYMENAAKFMLVTGMLLTYGYLVEAYGAWYKGDLDEWQLVISRSAGQYAFPFWLMILCNSVIIQLFWFKRLRRNVNVLVIVSLFVLLGMWLERFIIVPISLSYPFPDTMHSTWSFTAFDWLTVFSPFGLFLTAMFLFIRFVPVVPIAEIQHENAHDHHEDSHATEGAAS
ncbi:polysulfide reductase NrfD [bacterium]|nr:polysulfide reductase NrfD [bacterium]